MKKLVATALFTLVAFGPAYGQFNLKKALGGAVKAAQAFTLTDALKDAVASTGGKAAALTESQLGTLGQSLINAKYSQKQENEADDCGYDFLVSKGRNPWGIIEAFEKLQLMESAAGTQQSYIQKMFSSHPETQARIDHLRKRCEADGIARPATDGE